ncbi:hypothetical protein Q3G72_009104 [Acer saccharum]|nr:hypothetical protein Q3G72_009104 [Acer saccharum]
MAAFDLDSSYYGDVGYEVERPRPRHRPQHQQLKRTVNEEVTAVDYHKEGDSSGHDHEQETDKDSVMPVCELDKRVPLAKKILGLDVVVWWDRNENTWKVFDDTCPHRLAPLSQGRIDQWGRLQCVYHGWCFNGSGDCKFVPQATPDGPPIHTSKKACARVYPTTVQHETVWFWPSTDPKYKDIIKKKKPPFIPELDDPSFTNSFINRDIPCGYEIIVENLMDPAHVPYSHYGVMQLDKPPKVKADREGGQPLELSVKKLDVNGFVGRQEWGSVKFIAPCTYCMYADDDPVDVQGNGSAKSTGTDEALVRPKLSGQQRMVFFFFCIPVSPGNCRLIWGTAKNFGSWIENIIPKWIPHILSNLVVDSDLYLLHIEEHKIMEVGAANWQKECFVPTRSDALVVGFRRWMTKYAGGQINWGGKFSPTSLPPTPPREQLMDRYWSHVVNCKSCSYAYKSLNTLEVSLQVITVVSIGIVAATKQGVMSAAARTMVVSMAIILCGTKSPEEQNTVFFFFCVPVSPGNSRLIWGFNKNIGSWIENIFPLWLFHMKLSILVDSDLYLLHIEERKIMEVGAANWDKACFVPTRSDALVVGFRRWLNKYAGCQVNWGGKVSGTDLPPTPPKEQLMDRYRSHVVNCRSCSSAYKALTALEVILQIVSIVSIGFVTVTKQSFMPTTVRTTVVAMAVVCFAASRWLAHFIYKNFHYHDYNHALQ